MSHPFRFYDELFRLICTASIPKRVMRWLSERLSNNFEESFLVDFNPNDAEANRLTPLRVRRRLFFM